MPVSLNDKVQLTLFGLCYGQRIMLTNNYNVSQAGTPGTSINQNLTAFLGAIDFGGAKDIVTPYLAVLNNDFTLTDIKAQVVKPVRTAYVTLQSVHVGTGGAGTVANDAACITLRTSESGRDKIANKHIGPVPDAVSVAGLLTGAYLIKLGTLGAALIEEIQPGGVGAAYTPIVYHRVAGTGTNVTSASIGVQSRVQRRRTVAIGI